MNARALLLALLAFPLAAPRPAAATAYDEVAARAQRLESLGPFLARYVGDCRDPSTREECERNVRVQRKSLEGGTFATSLAEQTMDLVRVERHAGGYRFLVTPFIDGGGLALTNGAPRQQDAAGHPLIELLALEGALPAGMDELALDSALRTGRLALEVVFQPHGTWRMRRREGGLYEGVKARFLAVRLVEPWSGAVLAARVL